MQWRLAPALSWAVNLSMGVVENLEEVKRRVVAAAERVGRRATDVRLVVVTKTVGPDEVRQAAAGGATEFGENRADELERKFAEFPDLRWHFIGHLQTNKVRKVVGRVDLIQSVDSLKLAGAVGDRASRMGLVQDVLLEVNVSGEEQKYGFRPAEVLEELEAVAAVPSLRLRGLMTMAPFVSDPEGVRPVFRTLRELFLKVRGFGVCEDFDTLSMGMTQDFEVAIEEGSNMIRVGTAVFRG